MKYDKNKVSEWINENLPDALKCPICGESKYFLMDKVWELGEFEPGPGFGRQVLPVVAMMCNVCGHTILFNAIAVRAVKRSDAQGGSDE